MAVKIRPIALTDAASYRRCFDIVAKERRYLLQYEAPSLAALRANLRKNRREKNPFLVAVDGERVVGLAFVWRTSWPSLSHNGNFGIRLLPEYRGMGLGTKLTAAVLKMCRGKFDSVVLGVFGKNKPARKLFVNMGFELCGTAKKAVKLAYGFDDLLTMQKRLRR
jgi:L-amino acid N-acyltransferase YncA